MPPLAQALDGPDPATGGEVAPLREDDQRVVVVETGRQVGDVPFDVRAAGARVRGDEAVGQPVENDVDRGIPLQGVLEHDARVAPVPVHQRVDNQEGVAGAGVARHDDQRSATVVRRRRALDDDPDAEHPSCLPLQHPEEPSDDRVVRPV